MKYRVLILMAASMLIFSAAAAQNDCGDGLPCGKIPWDLPALPPLQSPTPLPTVGVTQVPPTPGPGTPTPTPLPTNTPGLDTGGLNDQVATLGAIAQSTPFTVNDMNGTPVDTDAAFTEVGDNAGTFFGYARGISEASFGKMSPLFNFAFIALVIVVTLKILTYVLPFISVVFGIIRNVVALIRSLDPL